MVAVTDYLCRAMQCPRCQHENRQKAKFCQGCGSRLLLSCSGCGAELPASVKFCDECGTPRPGRPGQESVSAGPLTEAQAERRQLTVMFCDLVGSTELSQRLDAEDLREVVKSYQAISEKVINRFDGHVAQYLGDGLLVYFGYPAAHEDDAVRAVNAGLGIVRELPQLNARLSGRFPDLHEKPLQVRIGMHTGPVVVGEMGGGERLAMGETTNLAARLQGIAEPDTVVVSAATARLIQGRFVAEDLGAQVLKGIAEPVVAHRVLRASGLQNRLELAAATGLTPLVGREHEIALLLECWERVKEGQGQVVLLSGEAGIGKSRLVHAFHERLGNQLYRWLGGCCSPYTVNSSLYPIIELLQQTLRFAREDSGEVKLAKLERGLEASGLALPKVVPLLATALSLPVAEGRYAPLNLTPEAHRRKTLNALLSWLSALAVPQPLVLVAEDLHWADPTSLELFGMLLDQGPTVPLLTLVTFRPEFESPWRGRSHVTPLTLSRLPPRRVVDMVERVSRKPLPEEVVREIVSKTDGVPLFVEELTKMVLESGLLKERQDSYELAGPLPALAIPTTLQDSLMARLDRLSTVKEVAQIGATIGREFGYELLRVVSPLDDVELQSALGQLVEAELLYPRGVPPQVTYVFKHALIQDTAYQSLLKSRRQQMHGEIARALVARFPDVVEQRPELVAHHFTEAWLNQDAVSYWYQAGQRAIGRSETTEVIGHMRKALSVLSRLPESKERAAQELVAELHLGTSLLTVRGYACEEGREVYTRARRLCDRLGETTMLGGTLFGLWGFHVNRADYAVAREFAVQILDLGERLRRRTLVMWGHFALGHVDYWTGQLTASQEHFDHALRSYKPEKDSPQKVLQPVDVRTSSGAVGGLALWDRGYADQAAECGERSITFAEELRHPPSLAWALTFTIMRHQRRGDMLRSREQTGVLTELSDEQELPLYQAVGRIFQGWTQSQTEGGDGAVTLIREGHAAYESTGSMVLRTYFLALQAEALSRVGQVKEALEMVAEARSCADRTGERFYEAELNRLEGELRLSQAGNPAQTESDTHGQIAEQCFRHALDLARRQQAKSWELRAAMSLARFWQQQGKREAARELLGPIYGWFTEGFDTADLKDAEALLAELA